MFLESVMFDPDGDVSEVVVWAQSKDEYEYITEQVAPEMMCFPVKLKFSPEATSELFHRAGKVRGVDPDYGTVSGIYHSLMTVVDRLIEYEV